MLSLLIFFPPLEMHWNSLKVLVYVFTATFFLHLMPVCIRLRMMIWTQSCNGDKAFLLPENVRWFILKKTYLDLVAVKTLKPQTKYELMPLIFRQCLKNQTSAMQILNRISSTDAHYASADIQKDKPCLLLMA